MLGVLAVLTVAGCGGSSSGVSAETYVKSVCTAVGNWARDIQTRSSALNVAQLSNPVQGKQAVERFMTAAVASTQNAVSQLKAAGTPSVTNGSKISNEVVSTFKAVATAMNIGAAQARALPTSSPAAFKAAADTLANSVRTSLNGLGAGLSGLRSSELESAAKKVAACGSLGG